MAITEKRTAFKPSLHGFHFKNEFDVAISFEGIDFGSIEMKLCGGMAWAALDRFFGHVEAPIPPDTQPPEAWSPLFKELFGRQWDCMRGMNLIEKFLEWMCRPNKHHWHDIRTSVGELTQKEEWPTIKSLLDSGYPVSMGLVTVREFEDPTRNHMVLATGYQLDDSNGHLTINIYDPYFPNEDWVTISIILDQKDYELSAQHSRGAPLRGFFHWPYDKPLVYVPGYDQMAAVDEMAWWILME